MLVVTPNLCFDRTLWVEAFEAGTVSRPHRVLATAGGKGVNVARALRSLGAAPELLGLLPAEDGDRFVRLLAEEGQSLRAVEVAGSVRVATIVVEDSGRATVFNEPGPTVGAAEQAALLDQVEQAVECPAGTGRGLLGQPAARACPTTPTAAWSRSSGAAAAPSSSTALGPRWPPPCPSAPTWSRPTWPRPRGMIEGTTLEPAHEETGLEADRDAAFLAAHGLCERGARRAVVTVGAHGVAWVDTDGTEHWLAAHEVRLANPIGAGDAFVAGLVWSLALEPSGWEAAVTNATAVAGAAVEHEVAGHLDPTRVVELLAASGRVEGAGR